MGNITSRLTELKKSVPEHVKIIAVSKYHSVDEIKEAYDAGHRFFGENRAQELLDKAPVLPADIEWHFIGHLQTNKVKQIIPYVSWIHSIDSYKILKTVEKEASKLNKTIKLLLQFHIAKETTKYGLDIEEATELMKKLHQKPLKFAQPLGLMGMATYTDDQSRISEEFNELNRLFQWMKGLWFKDIPDFKEISMGMSDDYPIAISAGSTMIRVGSRIFG